MNPYHNKDFFQFIFLLFKRLIHALVGGQFSLAADEIQLLVLMGIAVSSALVGTLLVVRKVTMLANALSHTILLGIVLTVLGIQIFSSSAGSFFSIGFKEMLIASFLAAWMTTFFTYLLKEKFRLQEDASIGLVFTSLFAVGIVLVTTYFRNSHIGIEVVMGNVDAVHINDLKLVGSILLLNILFTLVFFKEYQVVIFDEGLAKSLGFSPSFFNYLLMFQTAWAVVGAFRAVGVLLVLSFLVGPPLMARLFVTRLSSMLLLSALLGIFSSFIGVALSRHLLTVYKLSLSTGGITVSVIAILYISLLGYHKIKRMYEKSFNFR